MHCMILMSLLLSHIKSAPKPFPVVHCYIIAILSCISYPHVIMNLSLCIWRKLLQLFPFAPSSVLHNDKSLLIFSHLPKAAFAQHFNKGKVIKAHPLRLNTLHISILMPLIHCALEPCSHGGRGQGRLVLLTKWQSLTYAFKLCQLWDR